MIPLAIAGAQWLLSNWRTAVVALAIAGAALGAYRYRDAKAKEEIAALRNEYAAAATKQAVQALNAAKSQERTNEDLAKKHVADAARVRAYYERRLRDGSAVPAVPAVPERTGSPDAAAAEPVAAGSCDAEYVEQLELNATLDALTVIEWQDWYAQQRKNHAGAH